MLCFIFYNLSIIIQIVIFSYLKLETKFGKNKHRLALTILFLENLIANNGIINNFFRFKFYQLYRSGMISRSKAVKLFLEYEIINKTIIFFCTLAHYAHLIYSITWFSYYLFIIIFKLKIILYLLEERKTLYLDVCQSSSSIYLSLNKISDVQLQELISNKCSCSICRASFKKNHNICKLQCTHCFHEGCLVEWLSNKQVCPLCSKEIKITAPKNGDFVDPKFQKILTFIDLFLKIVNLRFLTNRIFGRRNGLQNEQEQIIMRNIQQILNRNDISLAEIRRELNITGNPNLAAQRLLQRYSNN
ncbi:ring zinc finger protein-related [Anaeramoeba flamelloides]|uniref:Ring zinc finger protein-related n=1 Tax=Anaeramoeba flamelloides TaxID=1746091 RepID=A0AAV7ZIN6_9EUKA|nr:ring zinc finger protein-related [Anaeramoeba flamelloides]